MLSPGVGLTANQLSSTPSGLVEAGSALWGNYALKNFVELHYPEAVSWIPSTVAWLYVFLIVCFFLAYRCYRVYQQWQHNAYRRNALRQLNEIESTIHQRNSAPGIPTLIKAVALRSFSRKKVASLSGNDWLAFLDNTMPSAVVTSPKKSKRRFMGQDGQILLALAYQSEEQRSDMADSAQLHGLITLCRYWIKNHRASGSVND